MENCRGSLSLFLPYAIKKSGLQGLSLVDVVNLGLALCSALLLVHDRVQCLHLGVTPANVLLKRTVAKENVTTEEPCGQDELHSVLLSDFGLSRRLRPCKIWLETTAKHWMGPDVANLKGTPGYAPVEQMFGKGRRRSDVYSLGATLIFAATGVHPFPGDSAESIQAKLQSGMRYSYRC